MYATSNRIEIKAEHADAVDQLFRRNAELMKGCDGFVALHLMRPSASPTSRLVVALWRSQDDYEAYKKSDVFKQTHAGVNPTWFMGPPKIEKLDVVYSLP